MRRRDGTDTDTDTDRVDKKLDAEVARQRKSPCVLLSFLFSYPGLVRILFAFVVESIVQIGEGPVCPTMKVSIPR